MQEVVYAGSTNYRIGTSAQTIGTPTSRHTFPMDTGCIHVPANTTVTFRGQVEAYRKAFVLDDPDTSWRGLLADMARRQQRQYGRLRRELLQPSATAAETPTLWAHDRGDLDNSYLIHAAINSMRANGDA